MYIPQLIRRFVFEEWGGTETVVWHTAQALKKQGIQTEILATSALSQPGSECREAIRIRRFDYHYPYWGLSAEQRLLLDKKGGNPYAHGLQRYLMQHPELTLIHGHAMQRLAGLTRHVARVRQVPYVLSFHGGLLDVPAAEQAQMKASVRHSLHYGRLLDPMLGYRRALAEADALICVGHSEYERVRQHWPDKRVEYLPNGVEPQAFAGGHGRRFRQQQALPADMPLLLCVGRIDPQKNQLFLLDLLQQLPAETGLVLIGPATSPAYLAEIQQTVAALQLQARVRIIPGLPAGSESLRDAYAAADIFVLPSRHEPFGIVVLEAWAAGKPVLCSDLGGLRQLVPNGQGGYRFADLAEAVRLCQQLLKAPELREQLGQQGREMVLNSYTWEQIGTRLQQLYASVHDAKRQKNLTDLAVLPDSL